MIGAGMASVALVLATLYPEIGNWWYGLTLLSPGAWAYYMSRGTRQEEVGQAELALSSSAGYGLPADWGQTGWCSQGAT